MVEKTDILSYNIIGLVAEIKKGNIRIPDFQRDYIWDADQVEELLESIWLGYPLGALLLWKTSGKLKERDPLDLKLKPLPENTSKLYLLDGQQRLISIYSVLHNCLMLGKKNKKENYHSFFNLKTKEFLLIPNKNFKVNDYKLENGFLPLDKVFIFDASYTSVRQDEEIITQLAKIDPSMLVTYTELHNKFSGLQFPAMVTSQSLSIACKIFERLNNTGEELNIADLMVALTYKPDFNLRDLLSNINSKFSLNNFEISERVMLQCISACLKEGTRRDHIIASAEDEKIEKEWGKTINSINMSVDFLRDNCSVPLSKFLPNEILLAPLSYFFFNYGNIKPDVERLKKLKRYFWLNIFSDRYASSQDTKAEEDIKEMKKLLSNPKQILFDYQEYKYMVESPMIKMTDLTMKSSFAKAILCFLASQSPIEFRNNAKVNLTDTFGAANQKQFHHIFPVDWLKTNYKGQKNYEIRIFQFINSIANISLISTATNREIWNTKPSVYFKRFKNDNSKLAEALKSHSIGNLDDFGINKDDFEVFITKRAGLISNGIKELIKTL